VVVVGVAPRAVFELDPVRACVVVFPRLHKLDTEGLEEIGSIHKKLGWVFFLSGYDTFVSDVEAEKPNDSIPHRFAVLAFVRTSYFELALGAARDAIDEQDIAMRLFALVVPGSGDLGFDLPNFVFFRFHKLFSYRPVFPFQ
jgi:hypothetical protein